MGWLHVQCSWGQFGWRCRSSSARVDARAWGSKLWHMRHVQSMPGAAAASQRQANACSRAESNPQEQKRRTMRHFCRSSAVSRSCCSWERMPSLQATGCEQNRVLAIGGRGYR